MTGYQEVLTDPSYKGQIVTMTYPLIGNYGINAEDRESNVAASRGLHRPRTARACRATSARTAALDAYLAEHRIVGLEGIDTRALVRRLRVRGAMNGVLSTADLDDASLVDKARSCPSIVGRDLATRGDAGAGVSLARGFQQSVRHAGLAARADSRIASSLSISA